MPADPTRAQAVFLAAAEIIDPAARAALVAESCGDDSRLRARVEALLRAHDQPDSLLDAPPTSDDSATRTGAGEADATDEAFHFVAASSRPDSLGRIGHYEVLQVLGKGGFGIVFRAFDDILQRVVAIKVMAPHLAATSPARKRFLREARSSAQVRHENVVQVYEVGEQPLPHLVMEFIPGETLQQKLDRNGPLDVPELLRIGRQIAEGLAAAHATDLIHRDIKPANILLEGGHHKVKITDFGLARAADDASISQSGIIAGTPMYMAPEQAKGDKLDQRADLFSLGSVLYQMAAGRPPFRANGTLAVLKRVAEDTPRPIREIIPEAPQWLCDIIAKLHAKNPDDRYQSAREVADVLADCEAQLKASGRVKDFSRIPRGKPATGKSGWRRWAAAVAFLLLPLLALAVTELAGVTRLFQPQAKTDPKPADNDKPTPPVAVPPEPTVPGSNRAPVAPTFKNGVGMEFAVVPKGKSWLGGGKDKLGDREVEMPVDFYLGRYEVTQAEWTQVTGENPSRFSRTAGADKANDIPDADLKRFPVENVSWDQCQNFVAKLNEQEKEAGWVYRLPTEAEWEYACRGGPMADKADSAFDFYSANPTNALVPELANFDKGLGRPCKVGSYAANRLGLFDMHGNVFEWCVDNGNASGGRPAFRGGGWQSLPARCAATTRFDAIPTQKTQYLGFRVARVPSPGAPAPVAGTPLDPDAAGWTVLTPAEMKSAGEATLTLQPDKSVLVGGKLPDKDVYTLAVRDLPKTVRSLRLDVLTHDSLPMKGPGRGPDFPFVLSEFKAEVAPLGKSDQPLALKIASAWDDKASGDDSYPSLALDANDGTGWATEIGKPHFIVFELAEPLAVTEGAVLRVMLEFKHPDAKRQLGCFRLSASNAVWKEEDQKKAVFESWRTRVAALPAAEQIDEVRKALRRLNPKFDGTLLPVIDNGVVRELKFFTDEVDDLAPLRALTGLTALDCEGSGPGKGKLSDLSSLKGLPLTRFACSYTRVADLSALRGMKLTKVHFAYTDVADVAPLKGMPVVNLVCASAKVADLSPLTGMKLENLMATGIPATDLSPLRGMPLKELDLYGTTGVTDLEPLRDLPLQGLNISQLPVSDLGFLKGMTALKLLHLEGTKVEDLSPLKGLQLEIFSLHPAKITKGWEALREMKTLKTVGNGVDKTWPAADFWERFDKGEFKK